MCVNDFRDTDPLAIYDYLESHHRVVKYHEADYASKNIRPTNTVLTVRQKIATELFPSRWGIKFNNKAPLIFNSRIETVKEKPFWYNSFKNHRALLPINGFYEFKDVGKKTKLKFKITIPDEDFFFACALLYEKDCEVFSSMITTPPNKWMKQVHNRMPALLRKKDGLALLDADMDLALDMCQPFDGDLEITEVLK